LLKGGEITHMGNEMSEGERLVKVETKFEMLTETLTNAIIRLEKKLDEREQNYVTKDLFNGELKLRDREIEDIKNELKDNKDDKKTNKQIFPAWISNLIAFFAIVVAIIAIVYK
jgi:predicted RNase H-like nuclease (RuvC/YqgF family)